MAVCRRRHLLLTLSARRFIILMRSCALVPAPRASLRQHAVSRNLKYRAYPMGCRFSVYLINKKLYPTPQCLVRR